MPASQDHFRPDTPMGANLVADGATFRLWAPSALDVYICYDGHWDRDDSNLLVKHPGSGHWTGFVPGISDGSEYKFYVVGRRDRCREGLSRANGPSITPPTI